MISELNENKLFQTKVYFKIILEEGFRIIDENKSQFNIYHSLFRRYIYCFENLNVLLQGYGNDKRYREHAISIVLRASLLDYLTTLYLATYQAEKKLCPEKTINYEIEIEKLISEQIRRIINIAENDKKNPLYFHGEIRQTVDLIKENFDYLFDEKIPIDYNKPGKSLRYKAHDDIKSSTIRKRLDDVSNKLENILYEDVFYLYDLYSKLDHFGTVSMFLENIDVNLACNNILGSIFHIAEGIGFCIDLIKDETNCLSNFDVINSQIGLLRGSIHTKELYLSPEYKLRNQ